MNPNESFIIAQQITLNREKALRVEIDYAGGYLELERDTTGLLADVHVQYDPADNRPSIDYAPSSSTSTLRIRSPKTRNRHFSLEQLRNNRCRLKLGPQIPLDIKIHAGAVDGRLDMTALKVANLNLDIGAGALYLAFRQPNTERPRIDIHSGAATTEIAGLCHANFRTLKFRGGAAQSRLSFDGHWQGEAKVDLHFGLGANTVLLPRHVGAKIRKTDSLLSSISLRGFQKRGGVYYSENYDHAVGRLNFDIDLGIGHTSIEWTN